jgi:Uma2 family endonuclease
MAVQHKHWIDPEEYLEIDRASLNVRYEYEDGCMYAMSGGTAEHAEIAINLIAILKAYLQGSCRVLSSDVRVQVAEQKYYYPDVSVSCHPEDKQKGIDIVRYPRLVIEVLSPGTETNDRGKKFRSYKACSSIQEYVLISSQHQEVEVFHRQGDMWAYHQYESGQEINLASIGLTISLADVYRDVNVSEQEPEEEEA